jgi:hypothetical protein
MLGKRRFILRCYFQCDRLCKDTCYVETIIIESFLSEILNDLDVTT